MLEIGSDRILFSTDWPFENVDHASDWFNSASISENDREKIGRTNAQKLFMTGKLKIKGDVMKATKIEPIMKRAQTKAKL